MLDFIEKAAEDDAAHRCMEEFYSKTLESFQSTNNERLWLKTNIKLARLWLERKDFLQLTNKLRELHKACQKEDGSDDPSKGTYSLEVYALEILMYAETRNNKRLKVDHFMHYFDNSYLANVIFRLSTNGHSRSVLRYPIRILWASYAKLVVRCTCLKVSG